MNEFLEQFVIESRDLVEQATRDLLELEQTPDDRPRLDSAFRAFHTLKGAAGIVEFDAMTRALHAVEDVLSVVRGGKRRVTPQLVTDCLMSLDVVSAWISAIESSGDIPGDAEPEAARIVSAFSRSVAPSVTLEITSSAVQPARALLEAQMLLLDEQGAGGQGRIESAMRVTRNVLTHLGRKPEAERFARADAKGMTPALVRTWVAEALAVIDGGSGPGKTATSEDTAARTLRVDVARIDALVKLTGELTTTKNAIGHVVEQAGSGVSAAVLVEMLREQHAALDRLVSELQRSVLNVRVLPMGQVFQRFPRLVREMSAAADKPARLVMEGEETEADKVIVEGLFEPLLHVIRNAMDHGIESADVRKAQAKASVAKIVLRALRGGDHVVVEIEDDGAGIDVARVRAVAAERGVASADAIAAMDDDEALALIFAPGFSTARTVTAISGRGVGMDSVRAAIEGMGGRVELENRPGHGATVRFLLPFTLMMTRVMVAYANGQAFGIPFDAVIETVRTPRERLTAIGAASAFVYRGETVAVIDLAAMLGGAPAPRAGDATLIVADIGGEMTAFEVDTVGSSLDVMLSPLGGLLAGVPGIAGATLLGDGGVLIVLDLLQLADG